MSHQSRNVQSPFQLALVAIQLPEKLLCLLRLAPAKELDQVEPLVAGRLKEGENTLPFHSQAS